MVERKTHRGLSQNESMPVVEVRSEVLSVVCFMSLSAEQKGCCGDAQHIDERLIETLTVDPICLLWGLN